MLQFDRFVARHGEVAAQAIIENLERYQGAELSNTLSLEERWRRLMQDAAFEDWTI